VGQTFFVCRAAESIFHTFVSAGTGLASKPVPALTLGAMRKSSRRAMKTMDSGTERRPTRIFSNNSRITVGVYRRTVMGSPTRSAESATHHAAATQTQHATPPPCDTIHRGDSSNCTDRPARAARTAPH